MLDILFVFLALIVAARTAPPFVQWLFREPGNATVSLFMGAMCGAVMFALFKFVIRSGEFGCWLMAFLGIISTLEIAVFRNRSQWDY